MILGPDPLAKILYTYCNVNAPELVDVLKTQVQTGSLPADVVLSFREQLDAAIRGEILSIEEYKELTGDNEYTTNDTLRAALRELRARIFGSSIDTHRKSSSPTSPTF